MSVFTASRDEHWEYWLTIKRDWILRSMVSNKSRNSPNIFIHDDHCHWCFWKLCCTASNQTAKVDEESNSAQLVHFRSTCVCGQWTYFCDDCVAAHLAAWNYLLQSNILHTGMKFLILIWSVMLIMALNLDKFLPCRGIVMHNRQRMVSGFLTINQN